MFNSQYKSIAKISFILLLCGLILAGCSGQFSPDGWAGPVVTDNTLYVISQKNGEFLAVDLSNPNSFPVDLTPEIDEGSSNLFGCAPPESNLVGYAAPVISDGIAYIADYNGEIYAIDMQNNGVEAWRTPVETDGTIVGTPVIDGTSLIVASGKELYAINAEDGLLKWNKPFRANGDIWSNPVIYDENVYFGSLGHKLYAVNKDSGQLSWEKDFDGPVGSTPLIVDGTVYIGTFESKFYALDAQTGAEKWGEPFKADDWFWTRAAHKDGVIYVGSLDHNVYAIDAATGKAVWSSPVITEGPIRSAAVIVGDVLLVASKTGEGPVYGIDIETGQDKWRPTDLGRIYADPWVDGDTVYYLNRDDELYALNATTGNFTWRISIDLD